MRSFQTLREKRSTLTNRLAFRVQLWAVLALIVLGGGAGMLLYSLHRDDLLDGLMESTTTQGVLLEQGLRHAMLDRDPRLLQELLSQLGRESEVDQIMVLDKSGEVRFSSDSSLVGSRISLSDPTCLLCHEKSPDERGQTAIIREGDSGSVLRNVNPIYNGPECFSCHSATDRINGVLLVDHSLRPIEDRLRNDAIAFTLATLGTIAALAAVLRIVLRRLVLRPVEKMRQAIGEVERGDPVSTLSAEGGDEMSMLAEHFNRMSTRLQETMTLLRQREEYLEKILNSADDGMVVVDQDLRVVTANQAYLALCGRGAQKVVGEVCCFAPQCTRDHTGDCPSRDVFRYGKGQRIIRRILDDRGGFRTYEIHASPLEVDDRVSQSLEVWRDITERTRLEAELAHSERLASLGLLASGISHEINNPLATITTCLDGLGRRLESEPLHGTPGAEVVAHYFQLIQKEVLRCRDLTGKLVLLSRKSSPVREAVDLNAIVEDTISLLEFEVSTRGARLKRSLAPSLPEIQGDEARLRQVTLNLLLNALEAIPRTGEVAVATENLGDRVKITIQDGGCGIAAADLERIFEPFYSKRSRGRGTGLGLFVSNQIVRSHGGTIELRSREGEGTEVVVVLPVHGGDADEGADLRPPG